MTTEQTAKAFTEALRNETKVVQEEILPLVKDVLVQIRDHRMAIVRDMKEIQFAVGSFGDLTKRTEQIEKLTKAITALSNAINDMPEEVKMKLENLFKL